MFSPFLLLPPGQFYNKVTQSLSKRQQQMSNRSSLANTGLCLQSDLRRTLDLFKVHSAGQYQLAFKFKGYSDLRIIPSHAVEGAGPRQDVEVIR